MCAKRFTVRNEGFICAKCGREVPPAKGTCRNHCPFCLFSLHVDVFPGDRAADCGGLMRPVEVIRHPRKGFQVVHRCERCGHTSRNILLLEDPVCPDDLERALTIMTCRE
ncbi:RNHCP domain-containing protein [Alicyclobacillus cellulosilyticus]|uniref:RNHCP domain-containing protein n=1 Tax=Alicyclobacillus cellulosilyticus TaxID=1003997 RepID=A0A917K0C2_9BACL|nr:RNHCP domain-containing protein [Alicyclobacillus cellulosilyticus]GGI95632.1 RNHCP domain-containing protein [Alicyclobacillus cellulosilyticus]